MLYVISPISNPIRFSKRYELFRKFQAYLAKNSFVKLITVELAFGERPFAVTEKNNPDHIQLRTREEIWHKENMINVGIQYLRQIYPDAKYVAWVDGDVSFSKPDWAEETVQQLQHFDFVQMFRTAHDLGPNDEMIATHIGFGYSFWNQLQIGKAYCYAGKWHPGFAWAARIDALDKVGNLIDFAILGAGDSHMAMGLIGKIDTISSSGKASIISSAYLNALIRWQTLASRHIKKNIGYVDGSLFHYWHGKKRDRKYLERWKVLIDNKFDPTTDLKRDTQGLYVLEDNCNGRFISLRDGIRKYFRARNEDSIDLE